VAPRDFTVAEMFARAAGNPSAEIVMELLLMPDYQHFVRLINRAIDMSLRRMSENPELRKDRSEDELTIELVTLLRQLGIEAGHEIKIGGHCDITIRGHSNYLWLAEAKKHSKGYDWLYQGFQQLNTRYSTGLFHHDKGGMLIYLYSPNTVMQMGRWKDHLATSHAGIAFSDCDLDPLSFLSSHIHDRSGLPYEIRHIPLNLHFDPQDNKK